MKNTFKSIIKRILDIQRYTIFKSIPHRRVISENGHKEEIFDLYQLGTFEALDSCLLGDGKLCSQENIELVELQPNAEYKPHYHKNSIAIIYITSGTGTFLLGDKEIEYMAGKRIVIPSGTMHGFNTKTRTLFLSIQSPPILNPATRQIDIHY